MAEKQKKRNTGNLKSAANTRKGSKLSSALKSEDAAKRKEALEAAVRKKIELEQKAVRIVERLMEQDITEEFLTDCGKFITSAHYKDAVEERSIIKRCGYPVCQKKLEQVPKQKYKISTKTNRVYDITERKMFCSNFCYRASKYFEAQIPKSPLWIREEEQPPNFKLLKEGKCGPSGKEIQLLDEPIKITDIENPGIEARHDSDSSDSDTESHDAEQEFVSTVLPHGTRTEQAELHRNGVKSEIRIKPQNCKPNDTDHKVNATAEQLSTSKLDEPEGTEIHGSVSPNKSALVDQTHSMQAHQERKVVKNDKTDGSMSHLTSRGVSKRGAEQLKKLLAKSRHSVTSSVGVHSVTKVDLSTVKTTVLAAIKQTLSEWKTEETLTFLYGPKYKPKYLQNAQPLTDMCKKDELDEDDLADCLETLAVKTSDENSGMGSQSTLDQALPFQGSETAMRPLPDYEQLKREAEMMNLRISKFYKGRYILPEEVINESGESKTDEDDDSQMEPVLPLVDSSSQNQIRKRIVLEKLKKVLPGILDSLQLSMHDVLFELNNLVRTFRLTNKNIIHKTPEWSVIALVLLSVLSPLIPLVQESLPRQRSVQMISTCLKELQFQMEDLESLKSIFKCDDN